MTGRHAIRYTAVLNEHGRRNEPTNHAQLPDTHNITMLLQPNEERTEFYSESNYLHDRLTRRFSCGGLIYHHFTR